MKNDFTTEEEDVKKFLLQNSHDFELSRDRFDVIFGKFSQNVTKSQFPRYIGQTVDRKHVSTYTHMFWSRWLIVPTALILVFVGGVIHQKISAGTVGSISHSVYRSVDQENSEEMSIQDTQDVESSLLADYDLIGKENY